MEHVFVALAAVGKELTLLSLPPFTGETLAMILQIHLSPEWGAFPQKYAVLWREGEAPLQLPLAGGTAAVPKAFFEKEAPFYLHLLGRNGRKYLSTNQVCGQFVRKN